MIQLPEVKQIDIASPIANYYALRRQARQDETQNKMLQDQSEITRMKLDEYKAESPQRVLQSKLKALESDTKLAEYGKTLMASIDTSLPDDEFNQQALRSVYEYTQTLQSPQYGFSEDEANKVAEFILKSGGASKNAVKQIQIKQGIIEPEKSQIVNDQVVTLSGDKATAKPIEGFVSKPKAESQLGKLIAERDALPQGSPARSVYDAAIAKETALSKGQQFSVTQPDGTVIAMGQGGQADSGLGKMAENKVQTKMLDTSNSLARLNNISNTFNETTQNYLTAGGKAKIATIDMMLKSGAKVSEEDKKLVENVSKFATRALSNLNVTLNELSGAAVTPQEYERISQTLPDPGKKGITNILSGDNAVEFQSKLNDTINMQKMALARLTYINQNGMTIGKNRKGEITGFFDNNGKTITIDSMPDIMKQRANEIAKEIVKTNPGMTKTQLGPIVQQAVAQEFGLVQNNNETEDLPRPMPGTM